MKTGFPAIALIAGQLSAVARPRSTQKRDMVLNKAVQVPLQSEATNFYGRCAGPGNAIVKEMDDAQPRFS